MTTVTDRPQPQGTRHQFGLGRLIRSELLKIRTTNVWWIFLIGAFFATALALLTWIVVGNVQIDDAIASRGETFEPSDPSNQAQTEVERQQFELAQDLSRTLHDVAAEIYTSGQFFGLMFAMLLGVLLITNEFHHQTATTTFLTTPRRTEVVIGKLATGMLGAAFFWLFATVLSLAAGAVFFLVKGYGTQLGEWPVLRAILFNALAYALWAVLGIGIGALIRSQIAAVVVGTIAYTVGTFLVQSIVVPILYFVLNWEWVIDVMIVWPGIASQVMISPEPIFPGSPPWWAGALALAGYGVLFGGVGTWLIRTRDIS